MYCCNVAEDGFGKAGSFGNDVTIHPRLSREKERRDEGIHLKRTPLFVEYNVSIPHWRILGSERSDTTT